MTEVPVAEPIAAELGVDETDFLFADGLFAKKVTFTRELSWAAKHVHDFDHQSICARGRIRVFRHLPEGTTTQDVSAGDSILVKAGIPHGLMALEANSVWYCLHATHNKE